MKNNIIKIIKENKIIRFIIVGGTSTCIDFIIYMLLNKIISITISKLISMTISCVYSFFINRNWTFGDKNTNAVFQIPKYVFSQCINIVTNVVVNEIMIILTNEKVISYICATLCAMTVNYILQNNIVFKRSNK